MMSSELMAPADAEIISSGGGGGDERFIIVPLYCRVGLYNQWISLQLATIFAWLTHRTLVLDLGFGFIHNTTKQMFCHSGAIQGSDLQVTDMFDVPVKMRIYRSMPRFDEWVKQQEPNTWTAEHWPTCFLNKVVQVDPEILASNTKDFQDFRHNRPDIVQLGDLLQREERVIRLRRAEHGRDPPSFYFAQVNSLFYSNHKPMRAQIARVAASIRPKPHLANIARALALQLQRDFGGELFSAIHLRRGDKVPQNPYIRNLKSEWVIQHVRECISDDTENLPLVICTDSPEDPLVSEIRLAFPRMVLMDEQLEKHCSAILAAVPFGTDTIVKAFVSSMACTHARRFFGTQGSTFSSYIHHVRGIQGLDRTLLYCYPNRSKHLEVGTWSWNRLQADGYSLGWFVVHPEDWEHFLPRPKTTPPPVISASDGGGQQYTNNNNVTYLYPVLPMEIL